VRSKILDIEQSYRKAKDFLSNTGEGLLRDGVENCETIKGMKRKVNANI